jgi:hypothetical protein
MCEWSSSCKYPVKAASSRINTPYTLLGSLLPNGICALRHRRSKAGKTKPGRSSEHGGEAIGMANSIRL